MKKITRLLLILVFVFSVRQVMAEDYKKQSSDKKKPGSVSIQRPEGEKTITKGSLTTTEGFKTYTTRRFSETENRITKTEGNVSALEREVAELKQALSALQKEVVELKAALKKEKEPPASDK